MTTTNHAMTNGGGDTFENDFEEVEIPVPWGKITGKWWGLRTKQPVIAIHGWQDNSGTFDNLAPLLIKAGFSVYCIDLPGHGFSSHLPPGQQYFLFWDGLHFLRRIIKHFGWKEVSLLGHSLGGAISFLYAATFPDDVKKYISIDIASPSVRDTKRMCDLVSSSLDRFLKFETLSLEQMPCYDYEEMLDLVVDAYAGSVTRESSEIMLRRGMKKAGHGEGFIFTRDPRLKVSAMGFITIEQVLEFASRITCEVLNIRATDGYKFDNPENYGLVLDQIEKSAKKLERFSAEGTHHLHLNNAASVAPKILEFLLA